MAERTWRSKGLGSRSSPPICMAVTMLTLSEAEETKMRGTLEILRISVHQW